MAVDVAEQAKFFDHLVELVPAKYYYDDEFAKVNPRFLAKAARDAFKAEAKTKAKEAKRERLDPDKAATTLELQRRKSQGSNQKPAAEGGAAADDAAPSTSGRKAGGAAAAASGAAAGAQAASGLQLQLSGGSMSRQELLERLHKKVEVRSGAWSHAGGAKPGCCAASGAGGAGGRWCQGRPAVLGRRHAHCTRAVQGTPGCRACPQAVPQVAELVCGPHVPDGRAAVVWLPIAAAVAPRSLRS